MLRKIKKFEQSGNKYISDNLYGFISIEKKSSKTWEIENITIEEKFRLRGLGKSLVEYAFNFMKDNGATGAKLQNPQIEALGFWNKMGWKDVHKRRKI